MRSDLIFATTLCLAVAFCSAGAVNQHWSERSLRTAIQSGIHRALEEQIHLPGAIRSEIEDIVVNRLKDHLFQEIAKIDGFVQGSFAIAEEFVNSAIQSSSRRTRWPNEQTIHYLEKEVAEADQKIAAIRPSFAGLMTSLDSSAKMSSLNLEQIIADVVSELMKDEAFQHIVEWLGTLPGAIHGIADEFLANKTFKEIFQMLGARSEVQGMLVQGLVVQDVPAVDPVTGFKSAGKHTGSESVMGLVGAGLKEAQSLLQLVAKTYRLIIDQQVKKLDKLVADLQQKMTYIPGEVMDYIHTSALRMIRFKPE